MTSVLTLLLCHLCSFKLWFQPERSVRNTQGCSHMQEIANRLLIFLSLKDEMDNNAKLVE